MMKIRSWLSVLTVLTACSREPAPLRGAGPAAYAGRPAAAGTSYSAGTAATSAAAGSSSTPIGTHAPSQSSGEDAGAPEPGQGCAKSEHEATLRPLDIFVLLDQSGSMTEHDDRWTPTTKAIKTFASARDAEGIGIGLQYFPLGEDDDAKCEGGTYAKPDVALAALPGNAKAILDSIDAHYFSKDNCCNGGHDGTPTRPALEGVIQYMQGWFKAHPERDGVILLATDGEPSSVCDNNKIDHVSAVIAQAAGATPAIKTYVVGIGKEDSLNELAQAGGTGSGAFVVDGTGAQTEQQLLETLLKIRGAALSCDFAVPAGMDSDSSNLNVQRSTSAHPAGTLVRVPGASDCSKASAGGFFYAGDRIQLCPDTCAEVRADPSSKVKIVVGCAAVLL